jgi:uncharacterized SAM-binding protein YcdF (DUF218 family)
MLHDGGVPDEAILRERASHDTRENARFAADILRGRGLERVLVVTCSWHLARATMLFSRAGLSVEGLGAAPPDPGLIARVYWNARERVSTWKDNYRLRSGAADDPWKSPTGDSPKGREPRCS